ncbi:hypothetical protein Tco_0874714, partial [Tanacetum coccineum]
MLKICPKLPGQKFEEPPLEEDILSFIRDLGHTGEIKFLSDVNVNHMHQPWKSFAAIINKCLSGNTTALESRRLSRAQILWGMYNNKQVDYVYLLWEDLVFQVENKNSKKNSEMYYPRFTKFIVDYFMAKDQAILRRNKMFWHYSEAFKTYSAYATGEKAPKSKATKKKTDSESSPKTKTSQASKGKRIKTSAKGDKHATTKLKGLTVLSKVALSEAEQMKLATKRSLKELHISHVSGLGDGVDILSKVPDEQQQTGSGEDEEEDKEHDSDDDNDDNDDKDDDQENDSQRTKSDDEGDYFVHPNLSTYKADEEEEEKEEEKAEDDDEDQEDDENGELYGDLNLNLDRQDAEITDAQTNQETEEAHVTLTTEPPVVQQQSSFVSSDLVAKFINPSPNTGIDLILNPNVAISITPSPDTIIPHPPILIIQPQQQTHDSITTTTIPTTTLPEILNFASLFGFECRVYSLESDLSELKQTNQFAKALSSIPSIVDKYLASKVKDTIDVAVQIINEHVKAQTSKIMTKVKKYVTETLGAEV